jgi:hypothetical protein
VRPDGLLQCKVHRDLCLDFHWIALQEIGLVSPLRDRIESGLRELWWTGYYEEILYCSFGGDMSEHHYRSLNACSAGLFGICRCLADTRTRRGGEPGTIGRGDSSGLPQSGCTLICKASFTSSSPGRRIGEESNGYVPVMLPIQ